MINLISTQVHNDRVTGPSKVFRNLVRGLDAIGYPYVVNRSLRSTRRLWIHDDHVALRHLRAAKDAAVVVGPNLFLLPRDIPGGIDLRGCLYVQPSELPIDLWRLDGFEQCPMVAWPVGIDTDAFSPSDDVPRNGVLVYHKQRSESELGEIVRAFQGEGHTVTVLRYGDYAEADLVRAASSSSVVVWHGCPESQGIALEEVLALDVPIVVHDVSKSSEEISTYDIGCEYDQTRLTAAPYWDERCGVIVHEVDEVVEAVERVLADRARFAPREFVRERLSLAGQARAFVDLWEHFGMTYEEGLQEELLSSRPWREPFPARMRRFASRVGRAGLRRLGRK